MNGTTFLHLPDVAVEKIFSFLTYDEIAKNRLVCKLFNDLGGRMLSRGLIQMEKRHGIISRRVKSLLPRRESERKNHPMSQRSDVLQAIETRISMLNLTYIKYIENNLLCFIPGKVLDEMIRVLNWVDSGRDLPRSHQLLQELRDLSSMALEHFDEHILPRVKEHKEKLDHRRQAILTFPTNPSAFKPPTKLVYPTMAEVRKIRKQQTFQKRDLSLVQTRTQKLLQKVKTQSFKIKDQDRRIKEQSIKMQEQEVALFDIKRQLDEWEQKFKDLSGELLRARNDLLKATTPPIKPSTNSLPKEVPSVPVKLFKSPRAPTQLLPQSFEILDVERKRKSNLLPDIPMKVARKIYNEKGIVKKERVREKKERNLGTLIENYIKAPLANIGMRKRKIVQDLDLS